MDFGRYNVRILWFFRFQQQKSRGATAKGVPIGLLEGIDFVRISIAYCSLKHRSNHICPDPQDSVATQESITHGDSANHCTLTVQSAISLNSAPYPDSLTNWLSLIKGRYGGTQDTGASGPISSATGLELVVHARWTSFKPSQTNERPIRTASHFRGMSQATWRNFTIRTI